MFENNRLCENQQRSPYRPKDHGKRSTTIPLARCRPASAVEIGEPDYLSNSDKCKD